MVAVLMIGFFSKNEPIFVIYEKVAMAAAITVVEDHPLEMIANS